MHLTTAAWLPLPRDQVFAFFSNAGNLQALTPAWLHFRILTPMPVAMRPGALIDYRIRIHGLPITWQSEITTWSPPDRFVDTQRRGPYRTWVHTHRFDEVRGGTLVQDDVVFTVPGGRLALWFVARDLRAIFAFRHTALAHALGLPAPSPVPEVVIRKAIDTL